MAAGGPDDHWRTDVLIWGRTAFGEPSDSLIREIYRFGGHKLLDDDAPLGRRLGDLWPRCEQVNHKGPAQLEIDLSRTRNELRREAELRGWELD